MSTMCKKNSREFSLSAICRPKKGLATPPIIFMIIGFVCVTVLGLAVFHSYSAQREKEQAILDSRFNETKASVANETKAVTVYLSNILNNSGGFVKAYGADNSFLFTLYPEGSTRPVEQVPAVLAKAITADLLNGRQELTIADSMWYAVNTGKADGYTISEMTSGTLFGQFVNKYCESESESRTLTDEQKYFLALNLSEQFSRDDIIKYFAITADYSGISGIAPACEQLFDKDIVQLTDNQASYLAYCYNNREASWVDFCSKHPNNTGGASTSAAFGLRVTGDTYWLTRQWVEQELYSIVGDRLKSEVFSVGLTIDPSLQSTLQTELDNSLASAVALEEDGDTTIDGTFYFARAGGNIAALVGSRSINKGAAPFTLNEPSTVGVYKELFKFFKQDKAHQSSYAKTYVIPGENGSEPYYTSIQQMAANGDLSPLNLVPVIEQQVTLGEIMEFFVSLRSGDAYIVNTVADYSGEVIYRKELRDRSDSDEWAATMVSCMIADNPQATSGEFLHESDNGVYWSKYTDLYCVGGVIGTNVVGKNVSSSDMSVVLKAKEQLNTTVDNQYMNAAHMPLDATSTVGELLSVSDRVNSDKADNTLLLKATVDEWVTYLTDTPIVSKSSRLEYETKYEEYLSSLEQMAALFSDAVYDEYKRQLVEARALRGAELLKYAN